MEKPAYNTISMSEIRDEPRKLAVAWHENATNWIGDKHKLASDIQNYANWCALEVAKSVRDECSRIASAQNTMTDIVLEIDKEIDLTQFIK